MPSIHRTSVRFRNFRDLRAHLDGLEGAALTTKGTWTAGQVLFHLAAVFEATSTPTTKPGAWRRRVTKFAQRFIVQHVGFPAGVRIPEGARRLIQPPADADPAEQLDRLRRAIDAFESRRDAFPPHPYFGPFNRREWRRFHLRHCEHHLDHITRDTGSTTVTRTGSR